MALLQTLARDSDAALRDGAARASRAFLAAAAAAPSHGKTWTAEWVATTCLLPHVMGALELGDDVVQQPEQLGPRVRAEELARELRRVLEPRRDEEPVRLRPRKE